MITIFTTAKPFTGNNRVRQLNALRSWKSLHPDIEVILFGTGEGYAEVAKELGLVHIPDVQVSEKGTPLVSSMFSIAGSCGRYPLQAYINCDIILLNDFLKTSRIVSDKDNFMIVGQRWDIEIEKEIDFNNKQWEKDLKAELHLDKLHPPTGSDYFLYKRGIWKDLPPMVVGRAGYDNWLIYYCRVNGIDVIDASDMITLIHQNHDYSHLIGGVKEAWTGSEAQNNYVLAARRDYIFTIVDANWRLTPKGLLKNRCRGHLSHFLASSLMLHETSIWGRFGLMCLKAAGRIKRVLSHRVA